eukprot:tig00000663_g2992.t1
MNTAVTKLMLAYALAVNAGTVGLFYYDKQQAIRGGWRVPERVLHTTAVVGGWAGGYFAQQQFKHKRSKKEFEAPRRAQTRSPTTVTQVHGRLPRSNSTQLLFAGRPVLPLAGAATEAHRSADVSAHASLSPDPAALPRVRAGIAIWQRFCASLAASRSLAACCSCQHELTAASSIPDSPTSLALAAADKALVESDKAIAAQSDPAALACAERESLLSRQLEEEFGGVVPPSSKSLVAITVGQFGKPFVDAMVRKFGFENYTFVLLQHDNSSWEEFDWYPKVISVRARGQLKWWWAQRFLTPEFTAPYEDDDLEVTDFDPAAFLAAMRAHNIQLAQPALTRDSFITHPITLAQQHPNYTGRWTDFVEIMVPVFQRDAWFWRHVIHADYNYWGYGYDVRPASPPCALRARPDVRGRHPQNTESCLFNRIAITLVRHRKRISHKPGVIRDMMTWLAQARPPFCKSLSRIRNRGQF